MAKVLGLHALELNPGVNEQEFEIFLTHEVLPLYGKLPGQTAYLVKGDSGQRSGKYLVIIELESPSVRDQIYPRKGDTWGLSDEAERALEGTGPIWDKLHMLVTQFPDPQFTDYVVVGE